MPAPQTSVTLIDRIRDIEDSDAWSQFVDLYTPIVYNFSLSMGLQSTDAVDLAQDVMRKVAHAIDRFIYREKQAKFRSWLFGITRNEISNFYRSQRRRPRGDGRTTLMATAEAAVAVDDEQRWEQDYYRQFFEWAADSVKDEFNPRIWQAFWRVSVEGEDASTVAAELNMTRAAVYVAKSRCVGRLREKIESTGEAWEKSSL